MEDDVTGSAQQAATSQTVLERGYDASMYCPLCSKRLEALRCKLQCPVCGYYQSCSDYY